jgi:4,5-dihydroxyphthalate decarboxylase
MGARRMAERKLKTAIQTLGHTRALKDGSVKPKSVDLEFEDVPVIIQAFRRMVRGLEFDISEMAITTYICAKEHGKPFTALPIFLVRAFHHGAIVINTKLGIRSPKDLEGKKIGVNRGYTVTTGVWARGILQHEHGVDLNKITWVLSGDEHVAEYRPPANVVPIAAGKKLEDMVIAGEIAGAIGVDINHPDVKPLIADAPEAGFAALRRNGHYPINHTLVVKDELLRSQPGLAGDVFDAFSAAKRLYVDRLKNNAIAEPSKTDQLYKRVMDTTGRDPLPYGLAESRPMVEAVIQYAEEQRILTRHFSVEELFPVKTQGLAE